MSGKFEVSAGKHC